MSEKPHCLQLSNTEVHSLLPYLKMYPIHPNILFECWTKPPNVEQTSKYSPRQKPYSLSQHFCSCCTKLFILRRHWTEIFASAAWTNSGQQIESSMKWCHCIHHHLHQKTIGQDCPVIKLECMNEVGEVIMNKYDKEIKLIQGKYINIILKKDGMNVMCLIWYLSGVFWMLVTFSSTKTQCP